MEYKWKQIDPNNRMGLSFNDGIDMLVKEEEKNFK